MHSNIYEVQCKVNIEMLISMNILSYMMNKIKLLIAQKKKI